MPIEIPRGLPFSVDTWTPISKMKRHRFLTHAHKDHSSAIVTHSSYPIYSTHLTKSILLNYYPQIDDSLFVGIEIGQRLELKDPDGDFMVTAFDANHCPGAVMFLFEGSFGNILHTGDCRLTPECLGSLPEKYIGRKGRKPKCQLDCVFLDCTFGSFPQSLPSKHSAIQQVIDCIWKHPAANIVYLTCDLLGQEDILVSVSQTFGSKIFVDRAANPEYFDVLMLIAPEIITQDSSCQFRLFDGFPKLNERAAAKLAEAKASLQPEPLIIRRSTQWYACDEENRNSQRKLRYNEAVKDQFGIWHVCYSMHSSREELEWALQLLAPKWVISTTPTCRAMELSYVKKHCFIKRSLSDDFLQKVLDIDIRSSINTHSPHSLSDSSSAVEATTQVLIEHEVLQMLNVSSNQQISFSPPSRRPPITLFGRTRFGIVHEEITPSVQNNSSQVDANKGDEVVPSKETKEATSENESVFTSDVSVTTEQYEKPVKTITVSSRSPIGSSGNLSGNLRNLYRSMNVPVPRPLPSLSELMDTRKRTKRRFDF